MAAPYPGSRKKPTASRTLAATFLMLVLEKAVKGGGFIRESRLTWIDYDFAHFTGEDLLKRLGWKMSYILGGARAGDYDLSTKDPEVYRFVTDFLEAHRKELAEIVLTKKETVKA